MATPIQIAPSILSADFAHLARDLKRIQNADFIHVDVMDGHFTPNLTFGPGVTEAVHGATSVPLDVHMMVSNPEETIDWYVKAGAAIVTVHYEAATHLHRIISRLHECGVKAGVSLNPATPVNVLDDIIADVDMVLLMSVNPGFGGQSFIPNTLEKLRRLRCLCAERNAEPLIEVDGGINVNNASEVAAAGATVLVAGSAVFGADDPAQAIESIRTAALAGLKE